MDEATRIQVAESLEKLANQQVWNPEVWQHCRDLVSANSKDELLSYVHDDLVHYSGEFHSYNIIGFRVKPDSHQLQEYREEFRNIAASLREHLKLADAKKKYGF